MVMASSGAAALLALAVVVMTAARCGAVGDATPVVTVSSGLLSGVVAAGQGGARDYLAFRGVPFAAPPVGDLRFKAPRPHPGWQGVRTAAQEGSMCPQVQDGEVRGDEDCLYLNVYTPSLTCPEGGYAVIVFFYGGSLMTGSADYAPTFGADFLVHNDVVLVLPNYRLGALGFLNLDTAAVPGNAGIKDGLAAMRWVQRNAAAFCGDPDRVTTMGQSAGAKMIHFMGLAEASRGMFRAAIQLSGVATSPMAYTEHNVERARALVAGLGNATEAAGDVASLGRALLRAPWQDITRQSVHMQSHSGWGLKYNWFVASPERRPVASRRSLLGPVDADGEPVVLARDPESLLRDPVVPRVPTLTGIATMEGLNFGTPALSKPDDVRALVRNLTDMLAVEFVQVGAATALRHGVPAAPDDGLLQDIARRVKQEYFQGRDPGTDYPKGLSTLLGDMRYAYPLFRWVSALDSQSAPLYLYLFDQVDAFNFERLHGANNGSRVPGAAHADDLGYLFRVTKPALQQDISGQGIANQTLREHTKLITDFAKTLNVPLLDGCDVAAPGAGRRQRPPYLYIGRDFREVRVEDTLGAQDRLALWDEVTALMLAPRVPSAAARGAARASSSASWLGAAVALLLGTAAARA